MKKNFVLIVILSCISLFLYHFGHKAYNIYKPIDPTISEYYLKNLNAKKDDSSGRISYYKANLYFAGYKNIVSRDEAIALLISSAEKGYNEARIHLARLFRKNELLAEGADYAILTKGSWVGDEIKKREQSEKIQRKEALRWLRLAIADGDSKAACLIAEWLPWNATQKEIDEAMWHLDCSARAKYGPAALLLAKKYQEGRHVKKDMKKAVEYFLKAYDLGMEEAGFKLAKCHLYGVGVPQNTDAAKEILIQLGRHGYADASRLLFQLSDDKVIELENYHEVAIYNNSTPRWPNRERLDNFLAFFNENHAVLCAARDGNWNYVSEARRSHNIKININAMDSARRTLLHYAMMQRKYDIVRSLLYDGANPNIVDASGKSAFDWAFSNGYYRKYPMGHDIAIDMIEHGAEACDIRNFLKFGDRHLLQIAYDKWDIINVQNFFFHIGNKK